MGDRVEKFEQDSVFGLWFGFREKSRLEPGLKRKDNMLQAMKDD